MAAGALFGVKILRRNTEHVVTLDANTMQDRLPRRRGFVFRGMGLRLSWFSGHRQILAQGSHPHTRKVGAGAAASWRTGCRISNGCSRTPNRRRSLVCRLELC